MEQTEILLQAPRAVPGPSSPSSPWKLLPQEARTPAVEEELGSQAGSQAQSCLQVGQFLNWSV